MDVLVLRFMHWAYVVWYELKQVFSALEEASVLGVESNLWEKLKGGD